MLSNVFLTRKRIYRVIFNEKNYFLIVYCLFSCHKSVSVRSCAIRNKNTNSSLIVTSVRYFFTNRKNYNCNKSTIFVIYFFFNVTTNAYVQFGTYEQHLNMYPNGLGVSETRYLRLKIYLIFYQLFSRCRINRC